MVIINFVLYNVYMIAKPSNNDVNITLTPQDFSFTLFTGLETFGLA